VILLEKLHCVRQLTYNDTYDNIQCGNTGEGSMYCDFALSLILSAGHPALIFGCPHKAAHRHISLHLYTQIHVY